MYCVIHYKNMSRRLLNRGYIKQMLLNLLTNENRKQYKVIFSEVFLVDFEHAVLTAIDTNSLYKKLLGRIRNFLLDNI